MDWSDYFAAAKKLGPNPFYAILDRYVGEEPGRVVELGFGAGSGIGWWVDRGWEVLGVDADQGMCDYARSIYGDRVEIFQAGYSEVDWGEVDVIAAVFALFFAGEDEFSATWSKIRELVKAGAVFGGQLIGPGDDWAVNHIALTKEQVEEMCSGLNVLYFEEVRRRGKTVFGAEKEWHVFHLVLGPQD
jgi:SAM-dependent methyltransferase